MVSGKLVIVFFIVFAFGFMGLFFYVTKYSQGREHNRKEQERELEKQVCLGKMKDYIEVSKERKQPVLLEKLNDLCGEFEFYYFPDNYSDMRKILIMTTAESLIQLKSFSGELGAKSTSMGYFVMYGDEFKIKDIEAEKACALLRIDFKVDLIEHEKDLFPLISAGEFGTKISTEFVKSNEAKIIILKKKMQSSEK